MKRLCFYTVIVLLFLPSCSHDFDLIDPIDPIPVVYLQLNPDDDFIYLTLTKSFADTSSVYDMARNPELVHYDSANINLEGWIDQYKVWDTQFKLTNQVKKPGIFAEAPGYCYESEVISTFFQRFTQYRLMITIPGMSSPVFSKIGVVGPPIVKSKWDRQISLYPDRYKIGISPGPGSAYCDLVCIFRYQQFEDVWVNHSDTFCLRKDIEFEVGRTDYLYADLFFNKIASNIKPISDSIVRKFTSLDLIFQSGDQYFRYYIETYKNAGDLVLPPKGNITNGFGLFTMLRTATKDNMTLDRITHDSLCLGEKTKKLGFVRW